MTSFRASYASLPFLKVIFKQWPILLRAHIELDNLYCLFGSTSLPLASTRWVWSTIKLFHCPLSLSSAAVNKSQQHHIWKKLEIPRIEPGMAGWEAQTLPLCYAVPPDLIFFLLTCLLWMLISMQLNFGRRPGETLLALSRKEVKSGFVGPGTLPGFLTWPHPATYPARPTSRSGKSAPIGRQIGITDSLNLISRSTW